MTLRLSDPHWPIRGALLSFGLVVKALPLPLLLCLASGVVAEEEPWGARMEIISENRVIAAGQPFEVGVHIRHREGFHSYWKNPGIVGFATQVDWELPEGFKAGPLEWPVPELVDMAGHTAHGYHEDVLLTATITPPETIDADQVTLAARIAWMACSDSCHPGDDKFSLELPVGDKPGPDSKNTSLFKRARAGRPAPLQGWSVELLSKVDAPEIMLQLTRRGAESPLLENPYFFSSDGQVADGEPSITAEEDGGLLYTFTRAEFGPAGMKGLPGLLAWGPEGDRSFAVISP